MSGPESEENLQDLQWIDLQHDLDEAYEKETFLSKMKRKTEKNPFIPIGAVGTLAALGFGLYTMARGDRQMSQYMMRARVMAQGFTVVAFIVGLGISADVLKT